MSLTTAEAANIHR